MEFNCRGNLFFPCDVCVVDSNFQVTPVAENEEITAPSKVSPKTREDLILLKQIIDSLGIASASAQDLNKAITSSEKLQFSSHRMYLIRACNRSSTACVVAGMLKVGKKKLFLLDDNKVQNEEEPLCVLDFYVHESLQRQGVGRRLFNMMLKKEDVRPNWLAIDRPSEKLTSFLRRHYGLDGCIPQVNNFVIYENFFEGRPRKHSRGRQSIKDAHYEVHFKKQDYRGSLGSLLCQDVEESPSGSNLSKARSVHDALPSTHLSSGAWSFSPATPKKPLSEIRSILATDDSPSAGKGVELRKDRNNNRRGVSSIGNLLLQADDASPPRVSPRLSPMPSPRVASMSSSPRVRSCSPTRERRRAPALDFTKEAVVPSSEASISPKATVEVEKEPLEVEESKKEEPKTPTKQVQWRHSVSSPYSGEGTNFSFGNSCAKEQRKNMSVALVKGAKNLHSHSQLW